VLQENALISISRLLLLHLSSFRAFSYSDKFHHAPSPTVWLKLSEWGIAKKGLTCSQRRSEGKDKGKVLEGGSRGKNGCDACLLTPSPSLNLKRSQGRRGAPTPIVQSFGLAQDLRDSPHMEVNSRKTDIGQWWWLLFDRTQSEILTAEVRWKLVKSWRAPTFCRSMPIFLTFLHGGPVQIGRYSAGGSPPIKAGQPAATSHLATAWGGGRNVTNIYVDKISPPAKILLIFAKLRQSIFLLTGILPKIGKSKKQSPSLSNISS